MCSYSETVAHAQSKHPGVQIDIGADGAVIHADIGVQEYFLYIRVQHLVVVQLVIRARLQRVAEAVFVFDRIERAGIAVVENGIVDAGAQIGAEFLVAQEVVLRGQRGRQHPDIAEVQGAWLPADAVFRRRQDQFQRNWSVKK